MTEAEHSDSTGDSGVRCGNDLCEPGETCQTCVADCPCPPACSDGSCNGVETCVTCPQDCGTCLQPCSVGQCTGAPKEVYTDAETGHEVWRMTNDPDRDMMQYYDFPTISPNGKHLIFRSSRSPFLFIIDSDGANEKAIGSWSVWNTDRAIDFSRNNMQGWFSNDSRVYYAFNKLYAIDIEQAQSGAAPDAYISQVSAAHGDGFFYPMVSPDGRKLFGVGNETDVSSGGTTLKLINVDGTDYQEFAPPNYYYNNGAVDVTHGWLGNSNAWYMNDDPVEYLDVQVVFDVQTRGAGGLFEVTVPGGDMWDGLFDHPTVSPSAYFIGNGEGLIGGHGRQYKYANTQCTSQDPSVRQLKTLGSVISNHYVFSPDAAWIATADMGAYGGPFPGLVVAYPVQPSSTPVLIARFASAAAAAAMSVSSDPRFSPDGTKNVYCGDVREPGNLDIYVAVFKKPDAPSSVTVKANGSFLDITWKPAGSHREIREYEVYGATSETGSYSLLGVVPEVVTYLSNGSKIGTSETSIVVDDTLFFPAEGVIEIAGLSSEKPSELISYTTKTPTSFAGCLRGVLGTQAAEHWNDSFVWLYSGHTGFRGNNSSGATWIKVRAVEWSGLKSDFSGAVTF